MMTSPQDNPVSPDHPWRPDHPAGRGFDHPLTAAHTANDLLLASRRRILALALAPPE